MIASTPSLLEDRSTTGRFDPSFILDDATVTELVRLATLAPSAFHLQNWSFVALRTASAKERLTALAFGQRQVADAAVTFIVCGELGAHASLSARLQPSVDAGILSPAIQRAWVEMATQAHRDNALLQRDEAVRSASLAVMALLVAAREKGLDAGVLGGFDADGVRRAFQLPSEAIPVMLVTVGRAAAGNWAQKPRRPVGEVLRLV
jgi:nitroreductase